MKEYERNNSFTERNSFKWEDFDIQRKLGYSFNLINL